MENIYLNVKSVVYFFGLITEERFFSSTNRCTVTPKIDRLSSSWVTVEEEDVQL